MTQSSPRLLDGPRLGPRDGGAADCLVIFVHGYGADGQDLIGLAPHWQGLLPHAAFAAPNGPERCEMQPMGYQWFGISRLDPALTYAGVERAAPALNAFIDAELARHHLGPDRLALVGFSQGTMMSLHVGLRRAVKPAAIIGFSGLLAGPDHLAEAKVKPPILLVHGDADPMIPVAALHAAVQALGNAGFAVEWHVSPGVGHSIDMAGLNLGGAFLSRALGKAKN
jgi:phospholipase/carboxylesterase